MNSAIQPVMEMLATMRQEFGQRLDAMNAKHDKLREELPEQFVPRREFEPVATKVAQFDEWRMGIIQKQYEQALTLQQRQDAAQNENLRENLRESKRDGRDRDGQRFTLNMQAVGWLVAILVGLLAIIGPHIGWH